MAFIGIDLGTTTSEAAIFRNGRVEMIKNEFSEDITPSVISMDDSKNLKFGKTAKPSYKDDAREFKRSMGSDDQFRLGDRDYNSIELSTLLLKYIKQFSEKYLNESVDRAVISVPANFTESQRNATLKAGEMAGFKVERIIHEPTAAALAFANSHPEMEGKIMVYDLGGGTFDVTILDFSNEICDVISSAGDTKLGGIDFDKALLDYLKEKIEREDGVRLLDDSSSIDCLKRKRKLESEIEQCKINLSFQPQINVDIPFIITHNGKPYSIDKVITRKEFEDQIEAMLARSLSCVEKALHDAKLTTNDIDFVLMVGGSSRVPAVRERVKNIFGPDKVLENIDPDRAVVMGASIQAAIIESAENNSTAVTTIVLDVVPHSIGTDVAVDVSGRLVYGVFSEIIPPNSPMQREFSGTFYTIGDNQEKISVRVYQRTSMNNSMFVEEMEELAPDNPDDCVLTGIPPAPAGQQSVTVVFSYNLNGTVDVKAKLDSTGKDIRFSAKKTFNLGTSQELIEDTWKNSEMARQVQIAEELVSKRLQDIPVDQQKTLLLLLKQMKDAAAKNDRSKVDELDDEINTLLFDLS